MLPDSKVKKRTAVITASLIFIALSAVSIWMMLLLSRSTVYEGISVEGIDISGLNKKEALSLLKYVFEWKNSGKSIPLIYGDDVWTLNLDDISLTYLIENAVEKAYSLGRSGTFMERLSGISKLKADGANIDCAMDFNSRSLRDILWKIKEKVDREPVSASVSYQGGKIVKNGGVVGRSLNIDVNMNLIKNAIMEKDHKGVRLAVDERMPRVTEEDIAGIDKVLATFSTYFNPQDINRSYNMKLSSERINNIILKPGEIFSMNEALGPRTAENGYKDAPIIFKNEVIPGLGGGVCQVVTTLYNAVLISRLDVVERTHHSLPLRYVAPGLDATIAEDYLDFKFRNSTDHCISIHTEIIGGTLKVTLLGKDTKDGMTVKLVSEIIEEIHPEGEEYIIDDTVLDGIKVIVREAKSGFRAVVHREVYNAAGQLVEREKISEDVYNPMKAQYRVNSRYNELVH